jgi:hypothetical protein
VHHLERLPKDRDGELERNEADHGADEGQEEQDVPVRVPHGYLRDKARRHTEGQRLAKQAQAENVRACSDKQIRRTADNLGTHQDMECSILNCTTASSLAMHLQM